MREPNGDPLLGLLRRVDRLEAEVRWWRRLVIAPVALLALLAGAAADPAAPAGEVRARRFVLTDASGREVADLYSPSPGSATLFVSGPKGHITIGADGGGTYLHLRNKDAMNEVVVDVDNDAPGLRIRRDWTPRAVIAAGREGASLAFYDDVRQPRAVIGPVALPKPHGRSTEHRPPASMTLLDPQGRVIWRAN
jgi:hypothetical protein